MEKFDALGRQRVNKRETLRPHEIGQVCFPDPDSNLFRSLSIWRYGCISKSHIPHQQSHQNDSTNLTMSIVCIHVTDSVAFRTTEPLSVAEESERDRIRRRRRWQRGNN
jgi:hypothetical protein